MVMGYRMGGFKNCEFYCIGLINLAKILYGFNHMYSIKKASILRKKDFSMESQEVLEVEGSAYAKLEGGIDRE